MTTSNSPSGVKIRVFRDADAAALAEWMDQLAPAEDVYTPALLVHQRRMLPRRKHPRWLVAILRGEPVGLARDEPQIFGSRPGLRRTWVGVRPDVRRRGIGSTLWQRIEGHARQLGARTLRSWCTSDTPEGQQFVMDRGFSRVQRELQSWVDPSSVDGRELEWLTADALQRGFHLKSLRELLPVMEAELRGLFLMADQDVPGRGESPPAVPASTFRRVILRNPLLDLDCSVVVVHDDRPVALSWLKGDRAVGRYGVEFTGTARAWRGRGLALLAKSEALHRVAQAGIRWVGTSNDEDNTAMLAVNRKLGHNRLTDLLIYERTL